ncbi:MAG: ABC transporter ATP-binding protein [Ectothiorhodospiraceae bacterium]|nr:ABC transporter ATP-binding protein [Ectothiorhodospiraceae bacterium]
MVDARGLHTHYGQSHVLQGVDLRIHRGETVCLMGRNGMGKTTTIRSILGLTRITAGTVSIAGRDMTRAQTHDIVASGIGYVPEGRGMFPSLTVRESLEMAARPGVDGRRDWTLERVLETFPRLAERINHKAGNLSGGEQQMVAIGRALMLNPDLLILDEATEGLAPLIRKEIWRVIAMVKETGIASLIVDKNVNALMRITDRSLIMVKGQVVYDGSSHELAGKPQLLQQHIGV